MMNTHASFATRTINFAILIKWQMCIGYSIYIESYDDETSASGGEDITLGNIPIVIP